MVTSTQPIRTQYSYALYSTYCFNSSSDGGFVCREIVLYIEHTSKTFNKEKTKAYTNEYSINKFYIEHTNDLHMKPP